MKSIYMDIVKYNMLMTSELLSVLKVFKENHIDVYNLSPNWQWL